MMHQEWQTLFMYNKQQLRVIKRSLYKIVYIIHTEEALNNRSARLYTKLTFLCF